eukprot:6475518-Amphidinium_carterae.1
MTAAVAATVALCASILVKDLAFSKVGNALLQDRERGVEMTFENSDRVWQMRLAQKLPAPRSVVGPEPCRGFVTGQDFRALKACLLAASSVDGTMDLGGSYASAGGGVSTDDGTTAFGEEGALHKETWWQKSQRTTFGNSVQHVLHFHAGALQSGDTTLDKVAAGTQDKRTIPGLRKATTRMASSTNMQAEATLLRGYLTCVEEVDKLSTCLGTLTNEKVVEIVDLMHQEGFQLPEVCKSNITIKRLNNLAAEKKWEILLEASCPFSHDTSFDHPSPTVAGLFQANEVKVAMFIKSFFKDLLVPMVLEGACQAASILSMCKAALLRLDQMDVVDMDTNQAICQDECYCVFRAFLAVLEPTHRDYQHGQVGLGNKRRSVQFKYYSFQEKPWLFDV